MRADVVTIFPALLGPFLNLGNVGRARRAGRLEVEIHDLRSFSDDPHGKVDDAPYGGGPGMLMTPGPFFAAVEAIRAQGLGRVILLGPQGIRLDHGLALDLASEERLILLCGRYEGVDERVRQHLCDLELSVGDYILSGGEVAAMVVIDVLARLLPGVVGDAQSIARDSFATGMLSWPQYTRPAEFRGWKVPEVLTSGDHGAIQRWRELQARENTKTRRPDLWVGARGDRGE